MDKTDYKELGARIFCFAAIGALITAFFKYLFSYFVPFIIAWITAYAVYPVARYFSRKTKMSRKICSVALVFLALILILLLMISIGAVAVREADKLSEYLKSNGDTVEKYFDGVSQEIESFTERLSFLGDKRNYEQSSKITKAINSAFEKIYQSAVERLGDAISNFATNVMTALPSAALALVVTVVACFYFAADIDRVNAKIKSLLPQKASAFLVRLHDKLKNSLGKYIRAYGILFALTFFELLAGFLILKIDYAFAAALGVAFIDFLPVFGTAAVLIPWSIFLLITGKYKLGIGMLVLLGIVTVVRQAAEPKIVGKSFGIHPLISLASVYLGYKIFGFFGMVTAPFVALALFADGKDEKDVR